MYAAFSTALVRPQDLSRSAGVREAHAISVHALLPQNTDVGVNKVPMAEACTSLRSSDDAQPVAE